MTEALKTNPLVTVLYEKLSRLVLGRELKPGIWEAFMPKKPGRTGSRQDRYLVINQLALATNELAVKNLAMATNELERVIQLLMKAPSEAQEWNHVMDTLKAMDAADIEHNLSRHLLSVIRGTDLEPITPTGLDSVELTREGMPLDALDLLVASGRLNWEDIHNLIISERTLRDRRKKGQLLAKDETNHLFQVISILEQAEQVFEDSDKANSWLRKPKRKLNGKSPIEILDTYSGVGMVSDWLERIEYNIAA